MQRRRMRRSIRRAAAKHAPTWRVKTQLPRSTPRTRLLTGANSCFRPTAQEAFGSASRMAHSAQEEIQWFRLDHAARLAPRPVDCKPTPRRNATRAG